jgi:hypothetical protein
MSCVRGLLFPPRLDDRGWRAGRVDASRFAAARIGAARVDGHVTAHSDARAGA